jgi:hypothetical protein
MFAPWRIDSGRRTSVARWNSSGRRPGPARARRRAGRALRSQGGEVEPVPPPLVCTSAAQRRASNTPETEPSTGRTKHAGAGRWACPHCAAPASWAKTPARTAGRRRTLLRRRVSAVAGLRGGGGPGDAAQQALGRLGHAPARIPDEVAALQAARALGESGRADSTGQGGHRPPRAPRRRSELRESRSASRPDRCGEFSPAAASGAQGGPPGTPTAGAAEPPAPVPGPNSPNSFR